MPLMEFLVEFAEAVEDAREQKKAIERQKAINQRGNRIRR